jgi:hypothetical protein
MALWDLLEAVCFAMALGASLASAKVAKVGFGGYALAIFTGLTVEVGCAWAMWTAGKTVGTRIRRLSPSVDERYFRALYFSAMLWIVLSGFLAFGMSSTLLRLTF